MKRTALAGMVLVLSAAPGVSAAQVATEPVPPEVCENAEALTGAQLPQRALELLKYAGAEAVVTCSPAWAQASQSVAEAADLAALAREELAEDRASARRTAEQALVLDRENDAAALVIADSAAAPAPATSWVQNLRAEFESFAESYLTPLAGLIVPVLAVLATVLLVARIAPLVIRDWPKGSSSSRRSGMVLLGGTASILGSWLLALGIADAATRPTSPWNAALALVAWVVAFAGAWLWHTSGTSACAPGPAPWYRAARLPALVAAYIGFTILLALLQLNGGEPGPLIASSGLLSAAIGALLLGWWLATRLRVSIAAAKDSGADATTAAHISALLSELGGAPPRGLEVPTGADATELDNALASIPGVGSIPVKIGQFLSGLLGATPWRAEVTTVDEGTLTVRVSRSGHSMGAVVINSSDGRSPDPAEKSPASDLQRLAAAYLLVTLDRHHGPFPGLAGCTDWGSLGLHYLATTDLRGLGSAALQKQVLARAVDRDPANALAQLAWQHSLWRTSDNPDDLLTYGDWLRDFAADPARQSDELRPLRVRACYTRAAVILNRHFLVFPARATRSGVPLPGYAEALEALTASLGGDGGPRPPGLDPAYWEEMKEVLGSLPEAEMLDNAGPLLPPPDRATARTPRGIYNLACWYASCTPAEADADPSTFRARAVALLRQVVADPGIEAWMTQDPQLAQLRKEAHYRQSFLGEPEIDFFALPEISPYAQRLRDAGFGTPRALHAAGISNDPVLGGLLAGPVRRQVTELAGLHLSLTDVPALRGAAVEILRRLSERGLATPAALAGGGPGRDAVSGEIWNELADRFKPSTIPPSSSDLADWRPR